MTNESEQAQARKRIGEMTNTPWGHDVGVWVNNCETLLEIVDSQARKIADLSALFQKGGNGAVNLAMKCVEQAKELAEARAIAEKMRDRSERPGGGHAFLPWEKL